MEDPDDDEDILRERESGCLFPGQCCMPGDHWTDECHTAEMLMQQEHALEIEGYLKQIEDLEFALKNINNDTLTFPEYLPVNAKHQAILYAIVKTINEYSSEALNQSDRTSKVRLASMKAVQDKNMYIDKWTGGYTVTHDGDNAMAHDKHGNIEICGTSQEVNGHLRQLGAEMIWPERPTTPVIEEGKENVQELGQSDQHGHTGASPELEPPEADATPF